MKREKTSTDNLGDYTDFGDIACQECHQQCQYAARNLAGEHGYADLGSDLRWIGDTADYHSIVIHKDDVATFVARYLKLWGTDETRHAKAF